MSDEDDDDDQPVKSGLALLKSRVSLIKLRHQADSLGLEFNSDMPWIMKPRERLIGNCSVNEGDGETGGSKFVSYGCLADLIPNSPSDWLPFDALLANPPLKGGVPGIFNKMYKQYCLEEFSDRSVASVSRAYPIQSEVTDGDADDDRDNVTAVDGLHREASQELQTDEQERGGYDAPQAWDVLYQTVMLLKEAGNEALKASLPFLAARRYDKAINYCSAAYLDFPVGNLDFLAEHQYVLSNNSGHECRWNELLRALIMIRLNLAMCYLKDVSKLCPGKSYIHRPISFYCHLLILNIQDIKDIKGSISQANQSIKELKPFATERGVVLTGTKLTKKRTDEPVDTYHQAKALQAKAYYRLGSARIAQHDYEAAVKTFELCVESTKEAGMVVDAAIMKKINEAKRCRKEEERQRRKKFKFMFSSSKNDIDDAKVDP